MWGRKKKHPVAVEDTITLNEHRIIIANYQASINNLSSAFDQERKRKAKIISDNRRTSLDAAVKLFVNDTHKPNKHEITGIAEEIYQWVIKDEPPSAATVL